jgi:hypothetical protein
MTLPVFLALLDRIPHIGPLRRAREVDDRRSAAMHSRTPDHIRRIGQRRTPVRIRQEPLAVHMRIDAARHDDLACRIDQLRAIRYWQTAARGHRDNTFAGNGDVVRAHTLWRHHRVTSYHQIDHRASSRLSAQWCGWRAWCQSSVVR